MKTARREQLVLTELVNCLGIGGTERQLVEQIRRLDRARFAVDLCCLHKVGEFLEDVRALGVEPTEFPLGGTMFRLNTAVQLVRLKNRMRENGTRLLHAHDFYSNLIGAAAARLAGVPYVVSRRDLGAWLDWKRAAVLSAVTRRAPFVLCNAYAIRDQLVNKEGVDPRRITVVYNGIDLQRFDRAAVAEPQPVLPESAGPVVVCVANMKHGGKGHIDLLRTASIVLRAVPDATFVLVGDGEDRPALERQASLRGIGHSVFFAGRRTDVPALLTHCQIAVCPSHSEGLSNAIMEAMAARLPVVATGVGGNLELVQDGRSGFLVPPSDPPLLAQRIVELARNQILARKMGAAGRRRIEDDLSAEKLGERINAFYSQLLRADGERRRAA
jgi:glycosyltransferase involved in cell wall biosynthesis